MNVRRMSGCQASSLSRTLRRIRVLQPHSGPADLLLQGCRLPDGRGPIDILIDGGAVSEISATTSRPARTVLHVEGKVVAPAFVDAHVYLDKVFLTDVSRLEPAAFGEQSLLDATYGNPDVRGAFTPESLEWRARRFLCQAVRHGTTAVRGVVDVFPEIGTSRIELFLRLKEEFAPYLDLQILAYPQFGIVKSPGTLDSPARGAHARSRLDRRRAVLRHRT